VRGEVVEQRAGDLRDTWPQAFDAAAGRAELEALLATPA